MKEAYPLEGSNSRDSGQSGDVPLPVPTRFNPGLVWYDNRCQEVERKLARSANPRYCGCRANATVPCSANVVRAPTRRLHRRWYCRARRPNAAWDADGKETRTNRSGYNTRAGSVEVGPAAGDREPSSSSFQEIDHSRSATTCHGVRVHPRVLIRPTGGFPGVDEGVDGSKSISSSSTVGSGDSGD